jgi:hypothetical protein
MKHLADGRSLKALFSICAESEKLPNMISSHRMANSIHNRKTVCFLTEYVNKKNSIDVNIWYSVLRSLNISKSNNDLERPHKAIKTCRGEQKHSFTHS